MGGVNKHLTGRQFWDGLYEGRSAELSRPFDPDDWRTHSAVQIARLLTKLNLNGKRVLEIGGGDAQLLSGLAKLHPSGKFAVLEYSAAGCALARRRADQENVFLDVVEGDMFAPPSALAGTFDVVLSQGLVEHFQDLLGVIAAKRAFLADGGVMFTLIPNMASPIYGALTRRWSMRVWNVHVPYTLKELMDAHQRASLRIVDCGFLGSVEFGMVAMALRDVPKDHSFEFALNLWLTRLSKAIHFLEFHLFDLPTSGFFSPYIWVAARHSSGGDRQREIGQI